MILSSAYSTAFAADHPIWFGNFTVQITRADSAPPCNDANRVQDGRVEFDSWARTRSVISNFCFELYVPGATDQVEAVPGQLDVYINAPNKHSARFVEKRGNNFVYLINLRDLDPVLHGISPSGNVEREFESKIFYNGMTTENSVVKVSFVNR
ncbi:MAG: hypothetical protein A2Z97_03730 [Bdellovibrionales bacterium GWB1_52_6]|nr:MAG: hypothetical protein A2Z97_03730 [Bdellovibrionales bacterium GWB1_52_6]